MTLKELISKLTSLKEENENFPVLICNLQDDDEEAFHFEPINSIEVVESNSRKWVSINFNKP